LLSTALPLRVTPAGKLAQQDTLEALLGLMGKMAGTTAATWPHARWFGLFEAFEAAARREKQDHENLKDALNIAFGELGIDLYHVQSVTTGPIETDGRRTFQVTLVDAEGHALFGQIAAP